MKIKAYAVRPDEMASFEHHSTRLGHQIETLSEQFGPHNAHLAKGYDGVAILGNCSAGREGIAALAEQGVKFLASRSAGINNIDLAAAREHGIRVANVPAYSPNAVSEFAVTSMLCLLRHIPQIVRRVGVQNFGLAGLLSREMRNQTVGLIGTGRIGYHTAKALSGFGCRIIGYDPMPNEAIKPYLEYRTLEQVLAESDILSLHMPLTEDNKYLIRSETISRMKPGVLIVNTSRGALMKTADVIAALASGQIGGLASDVYEHEVGLVHVDHTNSVLKDTEFAQLVSFPNVLFTPHCGFYTDQAVDNMVEYALQNLRDFETAGECQNEVRHS